ncbi:MAG: V-type ATP synthase subunit D [Deinococcus sp.]|nr:V-type ATP synthase subunit D [Deinococcus sp.]
MPAVSITRMELLAKQAQIVLANQGRDLLDQKRTALMRELMRVVNRVLTRSEALEQSATLARQALARAEAVAGTEAVRSAALATRGELAIEVQATSVMGVSVPVIEQKRVVRSALGRGYSLTGTSVTIDEAAAAFETEVESLIALAESELRLRRLAAEIQRTSRRVNALEHILIPRLIAERDYIQLALDERERADHLRLKRIKQARQRRAIQSPQARAIFTRT